MRNRKRKKTYVRDCLSVCVWEGEKGKRKSEGRRRGRRGNKRVCVGYVYVC